MITASPRIDVVVLQVGQVAAARGKPRVVVAKTRVNRAIGAYGRCIVAAVRIEIHCRLEPRFRHVSSIRHHRQIIILSHFKSLPVAL